MCVVSCIVSIRCVFSIRPVQEIQVFPLLCLQDEINCQFLNDVGEVWNRHKVSVEQCFKSSVVFSFAAHTN